MKLLPIAESEKLPETSSPDDDCLLVRPPPSSRSSVNGETVQKGLNMKTMRELLMAKLSAIAEEIVISGRNTGSPQATMRKALDDSCVLFSLNESPDADEAKYFSPMEQGSSRFHVTNRFYGVERDAK